MPSVKIKNEPFDVALRRFKRACEKAGTLTEVRNREFYEKPTTVRKRKKAAAVKRAQKKLARETPRPRDPRMSARYGNGAKTASSRITDSKTVRGKSTNSRSSSGRTSAAA